MIVRDLSGVPRLYEGLQQFEIRPVKLEALHIAKVLIVRPRTLAFLGSHHGAAGENTRVSVSSGAAPVLHRCSTGAAPVHVKTRRTITT